jgi:hypothetical protein
MIYDFTIPSHVAAYLRSVPKGQLKAWGEEFKRNNSKEFMQEVREHMRDKTPVTSAKIPNAKDGAKFDGDDYNPALDDDRLSKQIGRVYAAISDGNWRTLAELEQITKDPQASISAQLRHLRKERFGSHNVERQRRGESGTWEYRLGVV